MNAHGAIFNLAAIAIVLTGRSHGVLTTLMSPRLVDQPNGIGVSVVTSNDLLAAIS